MRKKYRIRKLSPLWWASRVGLLLLLAAAVYIITGVAVALQ